MHSQFPLSLSWEYPQVWFVFPLHSHSSIANSTRVAGWGWYCQRKKGQQYYRSLINVVYLSNNMVFFRGAVEGLLRFMSEQSKNNTDKSKSINLYWIDSKIVTVATCLHFYLHKISRFILVLVNNSSNLNFLRFFHLKVFFYLYIMTKSKSPPPPPPPLHSFVESFRNAGGI